MVAAATDSTIDQHDRLLRMIKDMYEITETLRFTYVPEANGKFLCPPEIVLRGNTNLHKRRSSVNFGGQDIFARKYMHEKLTNCPNFT